MISAGNTYQNALNSNATTQTEALAEIERAITQARLNGDIEKANALADLYKEETAAKQLENVDKINPHTSGVSSSVFLRLSRAALTTRVRRRWRRVSSELPEAAGSAGSRGRQDRHGDRAQAASVHPGPDRQSQRRDRVDRSHSTSIIQPSLNRFRGVCAAPAF